MRHYTNMLNAARGSEIMSGATFAMDVVLNVFDWDRARKRTDNHKLGFKGKTVNQREYTNSVGTIQRGIQKYLRELSMYNSELSDGGAQWIEIRDIYNSGSVVVVEFYLQDLKDAELHYEIVGDDFDIGAMILNGNIEIMVESHGADEGRMRETLADFLDKKLKRKYSFGRMK